jgi:hypothetical protein
MIIDRRLFLHIRSNFIETIKTEKNHNRKETHRDALLVNLSLDKKNRQNLPIWRNFFNCGQTQKNAKKNPLKIFRPCGRCDAFLNDYRSRLQIYHALANTHTRTQTHTLTHTYICSTQGPTEDGFEFARSKGRV